MKNSRYNLQKNPNRNSVRDRIFAIFKIKTIRKIYFASILKKKLPQIFLFLIGVMILICYPLCKNFLQILKKNNLPYINPNMSIQLFKPIVSTPYLTKNRDNKFLLSVADVEGNVYGISLLNGIVEFTYKMPGPVVAPLSGVDCNGDQILETLVSDQLGNYTFLDIKGNFLYKNRFLGSGYFSKPLNLDAKGITVFSDVCGKIHSIQNNYGRILWKSEFSSEYSFYCTPIFIKKNGVSNGIFMSKNGSWILIDLSTGTVINKKQLHGNFVSSPCLGNFLEDLEKIQCAVISTDGTIFLLDSISGEILQEISLRKEVVSTPVCITTPNNNKIQELLVSTKKTIYKINFIEKKIHILFENPSNNNSIRATPVLLDFDGDGRQDIIIVTGDGVIHTLDLFGKRIYADFLLGTEITATPIFFRKTGKNFGIFCGENGVINILHFPQNNFSIGRIFEKRNALLYAEFLGNSRH